MVVVDVEKWEESADKRAAATVILGEAASAGRPSARRREAAEDGAVKARLGVSLCNCLMASVLRMKAVVRTRLVLIR